MALLKAKPFLIQLFTIYVVIIVNFLDKFLTIKQGFEVGSKMYK